MPARRESPFSAAGQKAGLRYLSARQQADWQDQGYLVLQRFKTAQAVQALRQRAVQIVEAFEPGATMSVFSTRDQARQAADRAFLASATGIHCFFEEEAFDAQGRLRQPKALSINKIGHALHDLDPVFDAFSRGSVLADLAADLGLVQPQIWQSMLIFKQPGIGGEVRWHQDATFLHSTPITVTGFWFALEDATRDNGCLWVQPGGHRGPLRERFVRRHDGDGTPGALGLEPLDDTPWPDTAGAVPVEVPAGTLVCLHGLLPHYSAPNRSAVSRQAYTLHTVDAASQWSPTNWLQRPAGWHLRGF
ncbi:MAG: phytanoyl-CoA dioxygenase family protein [Betaproteobacteria bacterium]|jgi:phytanoyl-CoA hydroxylase